MHLSTLLEALTDAPAGFCGEHEPAAVIAAASDDAETRLRMLALGAIFDVFPLADRWSAIATAVDHWLFDPSAAAYKQSSEVQAALTDAGISGPRHNARVWWQVCRGVQGRFKGSFRDLLSEQGDDALAVQDYLHESRTTFPVISGRVISARWLDLAHRIADVPLDRWEELSVPLSASQQDALQAFDAETDTAHPVIAQALSVWLRACKRLSPPDCAVEDCPLRAT